MEQKIEIAKNGYQMIKNHRKNNNDILPSEILKRAKHDSLWARFID